MTLPQLESIAARIRADLPRYADGNTERGGQRAEYARQLFACCQDVRKVGVVMGINRHAVRRYLGMTSEVGS